MDDDQPTLLSSKTITPLLETEEERRVVGRSGKAAAVSQLVSFSVTSVSRDEAVKTREEEGAGGGFREALRFETWANLTCVRRRFLKSHSCNPRSVAAPYSRPTTI